MPTTWASNVSASIRIQEIGIHIPSNAIRSRAIAADIQEMAVNIEEISDYARRNAPAAVRPLPAADSQSFSAQTPSFLPFAARRALHTRRP